MRTPTLKDEWHPELPRPKTLGKIQGSPLKRELARVYRMAREAAGLSQRDLAERLSKALGYPVQRKLVAYCELEDQPQTFSSAHLIAGPTAWSIPIARAVIARHRAQLLPAVDIVHETHAQRLAVVIAETSDVTRVYAMAIASGQLSVGQLEAVLGEAREALQVLLELERAATVEVLRARGH